MELTKEKQVDVLLKEYESLRSEIMLYIRQLSNKFTLFISLVLGGIVLSETHTSLNIIYLFVPLFTLTIGYYTMGQVHILQSLSGRIRIIEEQIGQLNGNNVLMMWESKITPKMALPLLVLIYPATSTYINCSFLNTGDNSKILKKRLINPIVVSVFYVVLLTVSINVYSIYNCNNILHQNEFIIYILIVTFLFMFAVFQAFSMFRYGQLVFLPDNHNRKCDE